MTIVVRGDADHHRFAVACQFGEARKRMALQFFGQRRRLAGGSIPNAGKKARSMKIARHVRAHGAQSD